MSRDYHMKPNSKGTGLVSYRSYVSGFVLSALLTLSAYILVTAHVSSGHSRIGDGALTAVIIVLALAQFAAQLAFFLHLGSDAKPRWKT